MPKIGMEPIRRAEAINAALECICEYGIDKMTMEAVASKAGFSKGITAYYFKSKSQLIEESFEAFLAAYRLKLEGNITEDMNAIKMIEMLIDTSLPPLREDDYEDVNVSELYGKDKISLPEKKVSKLFINFISKSVTDERLWQIFKEAFMKDMEGTTHMISFAMNELGVKDQDANHIAYGLLAMLYGLSFFRSAQILPEGKADNREIAFEYIMSFINKKK